MPKILENKALTAYLQKLKPEEMSDAELAACAALVVQRDAKLLQDEEDSCLIKGNDGEWVVFDPLSNWNDFGPLVSLESVVMASHRKYDKDGKLSGMWYSAHAFFGSTSTDSLDSLQAAVCQTLAKLMQHNLTYYSVPYHTED